MDCTAPRVSYYENYGLAVVMMYRRRFITCNDCTALVEDIDSMGSCVCERQG